MSAATLTLILLALSAPKTYLNVSVTVQNGCPSATVSLLLGKANKKTIEPKETKTLDMKGTESAAYPIIICTDTQCFIYGNMSFLPGKKYDVVVSYCDLPAVRIESHEQSVTSRIEKPKVRFRSAIIRHVEYRHNLTRYRRLSVGLTRYWTINQPGVHGQTQIQFRYRMGKSGPVEYVSTHKLAKLKLGHQYFVEVKYFGFQKEMIKIQDEGLQPSLR